MGRAVAVGGGHMTQGERARLTNELCNHLRDIVALAMKGDYDARQWLCEFFPGHTAKLSYLWRGPLERVDAMEARIRAIRKQERHAER